MHFTAIETRHTSRHHGWARLDPAPWQLLGGLRFLLALSIVAVHVGWMTGQNGLVMTLKQFGPLPAVLCFLVISGYSIAHSIATRPAGFYARRFRRIYPLYALAVLAGLIPEAFRPGAGPISRHQVVENLVFLQTFRTTALPCNGVLWTLAVEVACYAMAPALCRLRTHCLLILTAASAAAFAAYPRTHLEYYTALRHGLPLLFLGWAWLGGFTYYRLRDRRLAGVVLVVAPVALTVANPTYLDHLSRALMVVAMAGIACAPRVRLPSLACRWLAFAGDLSYPLYLFHAPLLLTYTWRFAGQNQWFVVGSSLALALVMHLLDVAVGPPVDRGGAVVTARVVALTQGVRQAIGRVGVGHRGVEPGRPIGRVRGALAALARALCVPPAVPRPPPPAGIVG